MGPVLPSGRAQRQIEWGGGTHPRGSESRSSRSTEGQVIREDATTVDAAPVGGNRGRFERISSIMPHDDPRDPSVAQSSGRLPLTDEQKFARYAATWMSQRDFARLVRAIIARDVPYAVVYGVGDTQHASGTSNRAARSSASGPRTERNKPNRRGACRRAVMRDWMTGGSGRHDTASSWAIARHAVPRWDDAMYGSPGGRLPCGCIRLDDNGDYLMGARSHLGGDRSRYHASLPTRGRGCFGRFDPISGRFTGDSPRRATLQRHRTYREPLRWNQLSG